MKVYNENNEHVKTVPCELDEHFSDLDWIDTPDKIRLSPTERLELESKKFIASLSWNDRYLRELIEGDRVKKVTRVSYRDGSIEFQAEYNRGVTVIIPKRMYNASPIQEQIKSL